MLPFIEIFNIKIPSYGLLNLLACVLGILQFTAFLRRRKFAREDGVLLALLTVVLAFTGAKFLYLIVSFEDVIHLIKHASFDTAIRALLSGGTVFYGGVIAGFLVLTLSAKSFRIGRLDAWDAAACALPLAHMLGRIACFLAGCCYGLPSETCGIVTTTADGLYHEQRLLPVQLWEAGFNLLLALLLAYLFARTVRGLTACLYVLFYALWRFCIEFYRGDLLRGVYAGLSTSQYISILLFSVAAFGLYFVMRKSKEAKDGEQDRPELPKAE